MIVNMKSIYAPYHWFLSVKVLNRYTTSRTSTKYHEIQLQLPNSKFIMIRIFESLILNSHCTKQIVRKNSSIGYGGTNTLGTFLEQFLSMGIPAQFYGKIFWNKAIAQTNLEK